MKRVIIFFFISILLPISCKKENSNPVIISTGNIQGKVTNVFGNSVLVGVKISTRPPTSLTTTNSLGEFLINEVSTGDYKVLANKYGYNDASILVSLIDDKTAKANIIMRPLINLNNTYATVLNAISNDQLVKLQEEFDILNNKKIGTRLDRFGLTGFTMVNHNSTGKSINDTNLVVQMAKSSLVKNAKFTNVYNESMLSVNRFFSTPQLSWKIIFNQQIYKGLPVKDTEISLWLDSVGVYRIDNHFYNNIYIPQKDSYPEALARRSLIGKQIMFYNFAGQEKIYTVSDSSFSDIPSQKVIVPVQSNSKIKFRITWEINIGKPALWKIYIDTTTGEEIRVFQVFVT